MPCDFEAPEIVLITEDLVDTKPEPRPTSSVGSPSSATPGPSSFDLGSVFSPQTPTPSPGGYPGSPCYTSPTMSLAASASLAPSMSLAPFFIQPSSPTMSTISSPTNRLMELRLMHQYTTMTSKTLVVNSAMAEDIWQNVVPRMAFSGLNHVADAILAVSALHLRSLHPEDRELVRASHAYSASSLTEYLACLNGGINEENAEALFVTATLIAFQSTATRIFIKEDGDPRDPSSNYALPLSWFHAFQGVKTVVASSWQWIRSSSLVIQIIDSQPVLQLDLNAMAPDSFFGHLLQGLDEELALEDDEAAAAMTRQSYHHAVSVLNWAHKIPHRGAALAFPATVTKRFVELIEIQRPRALAVLACFFALLKSIESVWWLSGVARREVMGLASKFEADSPWWPHLEWAVRIALFDGPIIPPDVWGADWVAEENRFDKKPAHGRSFVSHIEALAHVLLQPHILATHTMDGMSLD